ncbi:hypothetical protein ECZU20_54210 [Escherichia coli]|nr:hypothetical protein ECZU20_54210 [Escherichia coli]
MRENPAWRPFRSRRLCRAVACAPGIPAKAAGMGATPFAHALSVVAAGPCSLPAGCHTRMSPCRRGIDSHNLPH